MSENNFESAMCNGAHKEKCDTIFSHLYLFIMKGSVFEHVLSFQVIYASTACSLPMEIKAFEMRA